MPGQLFHPASSNPARSADWLDGCSKSLRGCGSMAFGCGCLVLVVGFLLFLAVLMLDAGSP